MKRLMHEVQSCRPYMCLVGGVQQETPCCLIVVMVFARAGRGPTPLGYHPSKARADSMGSKATKKSKNLSGCEEDCEMVMSLGEDAFCEVTKWGTQHPRISAW